MAAIGGGLDKTERQHAGGRLTVRERIAKLVDDGSFHEIGAIAGKATYDEEGQLIDLLPSNNVMGRAEINGRKGPEPVRYGDWEKNGIVSDF